MSMCNVVYALCNSRVYVVLSSLVCTMRCPQPLLSKLTLARNPAIVASETDVRRREKSSRGIRRLIKVFRKFIMTNQAEGYPNPQAAAKKVMWGPFITMMRCRLPRLASQRSARRRAPRRSMRIRGWPVICASSSTGSSHPYPHCPARLSVLCACT